MNLRRELSCHEHFTFIYRTKSYFIKGCEVVEAMYADFTLQLNVSYIILLKKKVTALLPQRLAQRPAPSPLRHRLTRTKTPPALTSSSSSSKLCRNLPKTRRLCLLWRRSYTASSKMTRQWPLVFCGGIIVWFSFCPQSFMCCNSSICFFVNCKTGRSLLYFHTSVWFACICLVSVLRFEFFPRCIIYFVYHDLCSHNTLISVFLLYKCT